MDDSLVPFTTSQIRTSSNNNNYDVFISFRGADTYCNFTSHVHSALCNKPIHAFLDREDLRTGNDIAESLFNAIETSHVYLVIFSPDYASSKWCLLELDKILRCSKEHNKLIVPVFYKVDPSHVRHQTGGLRDAFATHEAREEKETVQRWRVILKEAANLSGFHLDANRYTIDVDFARLETELIEKIVDVILKNLHRMPSASPIIPWSKGLVGAEPHIENVMSMLLMASPEVRSVGIWGMGGIGKTTIGEVLCSFMEANFYKCYFFPSVREEVKKFGKEVYWNMALSKIFGEPINTSLPLSLNNKFVRVKLQRKRRIFLVFDDVEDSVFQEVEELADHHCLFGERTKIVMTSRDKQVLKKFCVDEVYEVHGLGDEDALKLFSLKAFKKESPPEDHRLSCNQILKYAQGNPLALRVFGSYLLGRDKCFWESAMAKMEKIPKLKIMDLLRISYDGLSSEERGIFLDVALIFRMEDMYQVEELLESFHGLVTRSILTNLIDKSLVCVGVHKRLWVHDLLYEMCLEMIHKSNENGFERCSRLADPNDIKHVLRSRKGIETVHAMYFNLSMDLDVIAEMENLRFLRVSGRDDKVGFFKPGRVFTFEWLKIFKRNYQVLPHLNYFGWIGCPLHSLPSTLYIKNVVKLNFTLSQFQRLWAGAPEFPNLKWINMEQSVHLTETPDFSNAKNLESINLFFCTALVKLHPSIQYLPKLESLWLESCYNLCEVPSRFESKVLTQVSLYGCTKIKECPRFACKLNLLRLSVTDIKRIPDCITLTFFGDIFLEKDLLRHELPDVPTSVIELKVIGTDIEEVPSSVRFLSQLEYLLLKDNPKLIIISSSISAMKALNVLWISNCETLISIPELPPTLEMLVIENCASLETIAPISNQSQLKEIRILNCSRFGDEGRKNITEYAFNKMQAREIVKFCLPTPRTEIPEWFTDQSVGSSLALNVPSDEYHKSFVGVAFCFLVEPRSRNCLSLTCKLHEFDHGDDSLVQPVKVKMCLCHYSQSFIYDHMILFYYPMAKESAHSASPSDVADVRGSHRKLLFQCCPSKFDCVVKSCGARPIFFEAEESEPEELLVAD